MNKNIEIIAMIYKSLDYLDLICDQLQSNTCNVLDWSISIRIIANDATPNIINNLQNRKIAYTLYNDLKPDDYYLNRVYRCWNYAGLTSKYDNICFVNSDMVFSDNWLANLLKYHNGINIPTSRLVESGKLLSGKHAISFNCGRMPKQIDFNKWEIFAKTTVKHEMHYGGLFMPCIFEKQRFIQSGGYPEGNIYTTGIGMHNSGKVIQSGDDWYFRKLEKDYNMKHITVYDSLVYHIQEGEKDS